MQIIETINCRIETILLVNKSTGDDIGYVFDVVFEKNDVEIMRLASKTQNNAFKTLQLLSNYNTNLKANLHIPAWEANKIVREL